MSAETTSSTLAGAIANQVQPQVLEGYDELVLIPRINIKHLGVGTTAQWPIMPRPSTANITEGSGVSNTAFSISSVTATIGEHGILIAVTDKARQASTVSIAEITGNLMRRCTEALDAKVTALFPAVQGGSGAISDTTLTADDVLTAAGILFAGVRGRMIKNHQDVTLALNGRQYYSLMNDLQNNGAALAYTGLMQGVANGELPTIFGFPLAVTSQAGSGGTSPTAQFEGCLFHRDCFGGAIQRMVEVREQVVAEVGGGRGSFFQVSFVAGFSELRDDFGVNLTTDTV